MLKKESLLPRLSIIIAVALILCIIIYIPELQNAALNAIIELVGDIPFAGEFIELFGAGIDNADLENISNYLDASIWSDILKSLVIIIAFMLLEKVIYRIFKRNIDRAWVMFVTFFACSALISTLLDEYIKLLLSGDIPSAIIVIISLIVFFAVSAVLIRWIYNKNLTSSIFHVVFKVLFEILSIALTSVFSVIIYGVISTQNLLLLIVAVVVVIAFCVIKFVEQLFCGK